MVFFWGYVKYKTSNQGKRLLLRKDRNWVSPWAQNDDRPGYPGSQGFQSLYSSDWGIGAACKPIPLSPTNLPPTSLPIAHSPSLSFLTISHHFLSLPTSHSSNCRQTAGAGAHFSIGMFRYMVDTCSPYSDSSSLLSTSPLTSPLL